jgi:predicted dehydrogenase
MSDEEKSYGIGKRAAGGEIEAPELPYRPRVPRSRRHEIGVIGCGAITEHHLAAYRQAGYRVTALMDPVREHAEGRRAEFFPEARVFTDRTELLATEVAVVDVATHPDVRGEIVEEALRAGKHVLSQKPFVLDLDEGERLADLADELGLCLAVNQNGRWAPHWSWIREAVRGGLLGEVAAVDAVAHFDHSWVVGTRFDDTEHLLLFDFAIHWFDFLCTLFAETPRRVTATTALAPGQGSRQPMLVQALVEYEHARATLAFHGDSPHFQLDSAIVAGTRGTVRSRGPDLSEQELRLHTPAGTAEVRLEGTWFREGFHGAMAELLCAVEEQREPAHGARDNLRSLALTFAACESARSGTAQVPGEVRRIGDHRQEQQ